MFFSQQWWDAVVAAWNQSSGATKLAGAGSLCFELLDGEPCRAWIHWDERGCASRVNGDQPFIPTFSGTTTQWQRFISGEIGAMQAVLTGQLHYTGALTRVMPYVGAFDALAATAKSVVY